MTREEAIRWMTILKKSTVNWVGEVDNNIKARCEEAEQEAFDMAIEALSAEVVHKPDYSYEADMVRRLKEALSADKPTGEWKPKNHHTDYCSNCGFEETQWRTADYNFCPSCGARMKGVNDEHTV